MHDHAKRTGCCPHWARPGIFMLCRWEVRALTLSAKRNYESQPAVLHYESATLPPASPPAPRPLPLAPRPRPTGLADESSGPVS